MEPSGRNPWQSLANGTASKTARTSETVAVGCDRLPDSFHGRRGSTVRVRQRALKSPQSGIFVVQTGSAEYLLVKEISRVREVGVRALRAV
jgi:hypothetical protein